MRAVLRAILLKERASVSFTDHKEDTAGGSPITHVGALIGDAHPKRVVAVALNWRQTNTNDTCTAVTIGGIAASPVTGSESADATGGTRSQIWYASVPTGTTATIVMTFSAATLASAIGVYRVITSKPTPAAGTQTSATAGTGLSAAITVPSIGVGIASYICRNGSGVTWSVNATEDYDQDISNRWSSSATIVGTGSVTVTTSTGGSGGDSLSMAAWQA